MGDRYPRKAASVSRAAVRNREAVTGLWLAIMADTGATVLVTLNALRLLRFNPEKPG